MNNLVYYSLYMPPGQDRHDLLRQLVTSIESLRRYNRTLCVAVFIHGREPPELAPALMPYGVHVRLQGSYASRLADVCPDGWPFLQHYPLLHKFLNFSEISTFAPEQVLFLDCDTVFFDDVAQLFARYRNAHCYAREEPTCSRSHYGYDPGYIDERALAELGRSLGIVTPPPFNLGVVLFNHGIAPVLASLDSILVSYAWRLLLWLATYPDQLRTGRYGEGEAVRLLRAELEHGAKLADAADMLSYPSANEWILDQIALWLTLGHLSTLRCADFSPRHVVQNGEFLSHRAPDWEWIVCHYFTQNMPRLENWLRTSARATDW